MIPRELQEFAIGEAEKQNAQNLILGEVVRVETILGTFEVSLVDNPWEVEYQVKEISLDKQGN